VNAFWSYFWPVLGAGLVVGFVAGTITHRRPRRRNAAIAIGIVLSIGPASLWHGPLGAADRFARSVERQVRQTIVYYEIPEVNARLHRAPLTRRVLLSGPADDFQRSELVRVVDQVPGVASSSWSADGGGVPLILEAAAGSILGFLLGLLVAYLVELRRRYNAQWNW
jgi:hypothetical protein